MRLVVPWLSRVRGRHRRRRDASPRARPARLRGGGDRARPQPVIDFEITANRPDCLSHIGLAREASAIWGLPLRSCRTRDDVVRAGGSRDGDRRRRSRTPDLLPALLRAGLRRDDRRRRRPGCATGSRPPASAHQQRRRRHQLRDARDRPADARLRSRRSSPDARSSSAARARARRMRTLDGVERTLDADMLVIADARTRVGDRRRDGRRELGDLGGDHADRAGERVFPAGVGPPDEQAARPEDRSVDPVRARRATSNAPPAGIARAAALFERIGAGAPVAPLIDRYPRRAEPNGFALRASRIARLLGQAVPRDGCSAVSWSRSGSRVAAAGRSRSRAGR